MLTHLEIVYYVHGSLECHLLLSANSIRIESKFFGLPIVHAEATLVYYNSSFSFFGKRRG
ncbi:hypothetical protein WN48_08870 [Eufriesea mexicana]|uniref:Uncharacterized protein n=1 Tax=Eufriesea mexicana TaxID=516756 RepID=A0A310SIZ4_9HYME|nr:hypothetical protein WN48_08870 [Eufriesea mexicana]